MAVGQKQRPPESSRHSKPANKNVRWRSRSL